MRTPSAKRRVRPRMMVNHIGKDGTPLANRPLAWYLGDIVRRIEDDSPEHQNRDEIREHA